MEYERSTKAREYVLDFAERSPEGPFDGIIAFSEGTAVAADVLLHQARVGLVYGVRMRERFARMHT